MSDDLYSDVYDDDYNEPAQQAGGPKALREAYEKEKEARKQLEDRLAKLEEKNQVESLASALKGKGVNPKAASLAAKFGVTPDKVDEFVTEYGDVFGISQSTDGDEEQSGGGVDEATQQQIAEVSGAPTGTVPSGQGDVAAQIGSFDNEADFWNFIRSQS